MIYGISYILNKFLVVNDPLFGYNFLSCDFLLELIMNRFVFLPWFFCSLIVLQYFNHLMAVISVFCTTSLFFKEATFSTKITWDGHSWLKKKLDWIGSFTNVLSLIKYEIFYFFQFCCWLLISAVTSNCF